ncbi:hypothetical protein [Hyphobacterium marinum]|uniref:Uncharacterized protein n=1 Tax=Hyphobacterium marinum TaxID=3116574 RepID=A0ABU7LU86_9PROT|nr:hypothetical protein [Hyphobacterium sp. Y6023]MEE2565121.1 hypothetical protein [Hyphobacterium sp. Y6023]
MTMDPIDRQFEKMAAARPEIDERAFAASVWQSIHHRPQYWRALVEGLRSVSPGIAWRAAPAAMALVVGSVSGAALATNRGVDDFAVFTSHAPYSISALADLPKAGS